MNPSPARTLTLLFAVYLVMSSIAWPTSAADIAARSAGDGGSGGGGGPEAERPDVDRPDVDRPVPVVMHGEQVGQTSAPDSTPTAIPRELTTSTSTDRSLSTLAITEPQGPSHGENQKEPTGYHGGVAEGIDNNQSVETPAPDIGASAPATMASNGLGSTTPKAFPIPDANPSNDVSLKPISLAAAKRIDELRIQQAAEVVTKVDKIFNFIDTLWLPLIHDQIDNTAQATDKVLEGLLDHFGRCARCESERAAEAEMNARMTGEVLIQQEKAKSQRENARPAADRHP